MKTVMNLYFEEKKRKGFIFTLHNIDSSKPYVSMDPKTGYSQPISQPDGPSYWSRKSGRYRTEKEQAEFVASGCIDEALPEL